MIIPIVSGSHRKNSQSKKVSHYIASRLQFFGFTSTSPVIDLAEYDTGFWYHENAKEPEGWNDVSSHISASHGLVIVTPEWDGMVPPALKNFFHHFTHGELAHKPALIVSVSAGINGAYPIAELRMSSYKNTRICYIPEQIIIRDVENMLMPLDSAESPSSLSDATIRDRIDYTLRILFQYARALTAVRESTSTEPRFRYGM